MERLDGRVIAVTDGAGNTGAVMTLEPAPYKTHSKCVRSRIPMSDSWRGATTLPRALPDSGSVDEGFVSDSLSEPKWNLGPYSELMRESSRSQATPSCQPIKLRESAASVTRLPSGLPAPCPASVSARRSIGRSSAHEVAHCSSAAIVRACNGSTRLSSSPVVRSVAG